jgi:hypothetical protein
MKRTEIGAICLVVALCTSAFGYYAWQWTPNGPNDSMFDKNDVSDYWLSKNNGTPAVAMSNGNWWTSVATECRYWDEEHDEWEYDSVLAFEYKVNARWDSSQGGEWPYVVWGEDHKPGDPCVGGYSGDTIKDS